MLEHIETIDYDHRNQLKNKPRHFLKDSSNITEKDINSKKHQLKELFKEWCDVSTTHGIPQIFRAKNKFLKIMWLTFFLICLSICIVNIATTFLDYISYRINVNIETVREYETDFPAVSFCNLNPYKTDDFEIKNKMENIIKTNKSELLNGADMTFKTSQSILKNYISGFGENPFGFKLNDMLLSCFYNSFPCELNGIELFSDYDYGNCFRFNGNESDHFFKALLYDSSALSYFISFL